MHFGVNHRASAGRARFARLSLAAATAVVSLSSLAAAQTYVGSPVAPGNQWGIGANWAGGVPNVVDANVDIPYGTPTEVEVDGVYTIGSLNAGGGAAITLPTKPTSFDPTKGLIFATSSGIPTINITDAASNVFYYSSLYGTQGFEKTGIGKFTFRFNTLDHTYTGDVRISGGTLGIQRDGSLGDANNDLFIGASGAATTATLIAEPGSNSGIINLAATRNVTLNGPGAQFSANDSRVNMIINGNITDAGSGNGYTKIGPGLVTVTGNNYYGGNTAVNAGVLITGKAASLPGYNAAGRVSVANASTIAVRVGGTGEWTSAEIDALRANATLTADSSLGFDTTNATAPVDYAGLTNAEAYSIAKIGPGTLRLTGANNYTGTRVRLYGGTLALAAGTGSLPSNVNVIFFDSVDSPTLDLGGNTQTVANVSESANSTSRLTNGNLTMNGDTNLDVQGNNGLLLDMSGLNSFTFNRPNRAVRVLPNTINNTPPAIGTTIEYRMAQNNTIKANNVQIGGAAGGSQGANHEGRLVLGTGTTTLNITNIVSSVDVGVFQLGGFNGTGRVTFPATATAASTFVLRAGDGVSALPIWRIGETSSGVRSGGGVADLTGGSVDALVGDLTLSRHTAVSGNGESSTLIMGAGNITANRLVLGQKLNGGANPPSPTFNDPFLTSTLTLNGGTITANTVLIGEALTGTGAIPNPGATKYVVNVNLNGGELQAGSIVNNTGANVNAFSEAQSVRNFNFAGGVLTHLAGQDLTITGTASTDSDALTTGNRINLVAGTGGGVRVAAGRIVTLGANTALIGTGTLVKSGEGSFVVKDVLEGTVKIDDGNLVVDNGGVAPNADVNATLITNYTGATVAGDVVAKIVSGYNAGTWDGAGYQSSAAAAAGNTALGYAEASELGVTSFNGYAVDSTTFIVDYTLKGDVNLDHTVNFDDLLVLAQNYNATGVDWVRGDANYDTAVDFDDLLSLAQNYGASLLASGISVDAALAGSFEADWALARSLVPEPTSVFTLGLGAMLIRRKR